MRLIFSKNASDEILVQIQKGTIVEPFSYIEMVQQLLTDYDFEETTYNDLTEDEIEKVDSMLDKIKVLFEEENESDNAEIEL